MLFRLIFWLVLIESLLHCAPARADQALVSTGSRWRFNDTGANLGVAWQAPAFDDTAWTSGPAQLGYGDGDEATVVSFGPSSSNKFITTYFRLNFTLPPTPAFVGYTLRLLRDDGAVVYINGAEVARSNMPAGAIGSATFASTTINGAAESAWNDFALPVAACNAGTNTLAVEIHQSTLTSSDISFDLQLTGLELTSTTVVRGPYLQNLTPSSAVVRWRTAGLADSVVRFGDAPTSLTRSTSSTLLTTEHAQVIPALQYRSTYYYSIGSTLQTFAGGDAEHTFTTLPPFGVVQPVRLWAIGDCGTGDANEAAVCDAFFTWNAGRAVSGMLLLGDNAYFDGSDAEYQAGVFDSLHDAIRRWCVWPALGNHDAVSADSPTQAGPYFDNFTLPTAGEAGGLASGTEAYFSYDVSNVHLICLDSADSDLSVNGPMFTWLRADLVQTQQTWIIAYWHHPPYTKGTHDSDDDGDSEGRMGIMRSVALPILEANGVDLVLCGHSHVYERSMLLDGHYGASGTLTPAMKLNAGDGRVDGAGAYHKPLRVKAPHAGAVYVVSGGGSGPPEANPPLNHPAMLYGYNLFNSTVVEITGTRLDVHVLGTAANELDHFTIVKDAPAAADGAVLEMR